MGRPGPVVDRDRVVTGPAEDVVPIAVGREDEIVAGASARPFVRVAEKVEAVVAAVAGEVVCAEPTIQKVVVSAAVEIVVAIVAEQELSSCDASIIYCAGERAVGWRASVGRTWATVDVVGPPTALKEVSADSAPDVVPAPAAVDIIVP